jgi:hypothetical protein
MVLTCAVDVLRCGRGRSSSSKGHNWAEKMPLLDSLTDTPSIALASYEFMGRDGIRGVYISVKEQYNTRASIDSGPGMTDVVSPENGDSSENRSDESMSMRGIESEDDTLIPLKFALPEALNI